MGRSPCCVKEGLKKGPWTQEEDDKLIAFVKEHGHGNWRALPKKCGLLRCGKSCRLRWNNYLRPDIKRGMFTQSEEQKIFQLHALVGNKWAFIASQLPKRTDNEIKNYWNTVLKKRLQKERVNSLMSFGVLRTLTSPPEARLRQDTKSTQRQDDRNNVKSTVGSSISKNLSCNNSAASSVMSCAHLAQWESARLEAEARLAKESQSSRKTHALFSFTAATAISALSNHTHTNHPPLAAHAQLSTCLIPNTLPSSSSNPGCLIHSLHPSSTISPLLSSSASSLSLPSCRCAASTNSSSTSTSSKTLLSSLPSQENIASALTLGPNGRLSWQAKELTFTPSSPSTSQSSLISQMLCQIERDHNGREEVITELQATTKDGGLKGEDVLRGGQVDMSLEEATSSIILDLNSTNMESSSLDSWHDFIWDVENSCSDVVSSTTVVSTSPPGEQFSHGAPASCKTTTSEGLCSSSLDLEGLDFDSFISCEHYNSSQHHTSLLILKELLWDTPPSLSISSSSIVN